MATSIDGAVSLARRWFDDDGDWHDRYHSSAWYDWGRWVLVGAIVLIVVVAALTSAFTARSRQRRGLTPWYGTGWMAGGTGYDNAKMDHAEMGYQNGGPPAHPNGGYYGNQQYGVAPPQTVYQQDMGRMK